ncbi:MAG: cyclopropane-fatty-acyl-phospholipid synthase [Actinomycetota bacterium]|jgi:cyclopropane-fatty-acyl-phospholipid synthase|nr:cyclopropane-fatty-acyl-phospholipid synthase [Actinomycetota bacterium]
MSGSSQPVAEAMRPLVRRLVGSDNPPVALRFWDGSRLGPDPAPASVVVNSPDALRRLVYAPNELGLGRAYVAGEIDVEGSVFAALELRDSIAPPDVHVDLGLGVRGWLGAVATAKKFGALGRPPTRPEEEAQLHGRRHSKERDAAAIAHHYDVGNEFYRTLLGETMAYSCAYFEHGDATSLEDAQRAKFDLICRKLGLRPGQRLLDVGCGWGGMVMHAATNYGVDAIGITLSTEQAELATQRIKEAGLDDRIEIRVQDYRDLDDAPFDAISSIGMFEHVGLAQLATYAGCLYQRLKPTGRLLNHGISRPAGEKAAIDKHSFIGRYVFPDGELHEVGSVVTVLQEAGFEVRDVESLREHYARTLRRWVDNLEAGWDRMVELAGVRRARIWRLYLAASAINFERNRTSIHQVLAVRPGSDGTSAFPGTRREWLGVAAG